MLIAKNKLFHSGNRTKCLEDHDKGSFEIV